MEIHSPEFRAGNAALICFNCIPISVKNFLYAQVKSKRIDQTLPPKNACAFAHGHAL